MEPEIQEKIRLDADAWAPVVAISGSLSFLLSTYLQTTTSSLHVFTITPGEVWNIHITIDSDSSVQDFLATIDKYFRSKNELLVASQTFCLRTGSSNEWEASVEKPSNSQGFAVPREIRCTLIEEQESRFLEVKIGGEDSVKNTRFLRQLAHVSRQLVSTTGGQRLLRELDLVCDHDRQDLQRWNQHPLSTIKSTVHETISQRVLESPNSVAVDSWDGKLTYQELDTLASKTCSLLLDAGAKPGDCIPLCFEKSLWALVAMLGVMKSGCSFLLMDVSHPTNRLQTLSQETKASIVLCSSGQEDRASSMASCALVVSNSALSAAAADHKVTVAPSDVAVVVFTSGTTGTPKGIQIEHQSILSSLWALSELPEIDKQTRYYQFSSYAFDAGYGDILMTLIRGGCVCVPSDEERLNNLAESIRKFNANTVLLTPTVLRLLSPSGVPCLKKVICGGEKVTDDLVQLWTTKSDLIIMYGPAETTIACVAKKAHPVSDDDVRIGFPTNSRAWVARLDDPTKLAPVGAVGELVAQGPGVARGYINNESDKAEAFLETVPWAADWESCVASVGRSYRTGDLVRYADDGELIFVGRRDRQVKLRGQRIELEDIELKLKQNLRLPEANMFLEVLDVFGSNKLVAFIHDPIIQDTAHGEDVDRDIVRMPDEITLEIEALRVRISEILPAYMWPIIWIPLKAIPLTPTGKLDRRKLLSIGQAFYSRANSSDSEDEGLSPIESVLARIWRRLLPSAQNLTPETNFFHLGGDSLQIMKLVAMANEEGFHLTMQKVLKSPTLSEMAIAMQEVPTVAATPNGSKSDLRTTSTPNSIALDDVRSLDEYDINHKEILSIYPCTPLQAGLMSLSLARPSLYSSRFVFDLSTSVDVEKFRLAWESATDTFHILRTAIVPSSTSLVQVVLQHHSEWVEIKQDLASFLAADKAVPFQLGQVLNRYYYIQGPLSGQAHFVWTIHHAVFDGWSLDPVVDHIRRHYHASSTESVKSAGTFEEFVNFCKDLDRDDCVSFWRKQLQNAPTPSFPNVPTAGHLTTDKCSLQHTMAAPTAITTTMTTVARAAWALLLSQYENSDDVVFGNSLHGRNSLPPGLQDVVGPTIATLPIRVRLDLNQSIARFLENLQEQMSTMIPYEQLGLSQIMDIDQGVKNAASFRTLLIVQVAESSEDQEIRLREVDRSLHEYPLVLTLVPGESHVQIIATFDDDSISPAQVQRILQQFEQIFQQLVSVPKDTTVGDLDLASRADKETMFFWNFRHHKAYEVCVHELIGERVKHSRASPAIFSRDGSMDYSTLDGLSNSLAREIVRSGVSPGEAVGVLFEKSQWAIVSILAVIKAGACFAPLSPSNPLGRLESIASDAGIKTVLCSPRQASAFSNAKWHTILVSSDTAGLDVGAPPIHVQGVSPDSLLYILSTSGTTGVPKIFGVQHKSFATGAIARAPLLRRGADSRVLQFAPFPFDPSIEDILTTLMFGGCICVPSDEDITGDIGAFMKSARVDFANITPSVAHTLNQHELPDLKILLLSGEAPDQPLVDKWDGLVKLMNGYGPSECSVKCAINCHLSRNDPQNIGYSAGTSLWVVRPENHNRLTPLGAVGELIIESPHLANGYLNRPEANADKFILSPPWLRDFRGGQPTRLYKTGDLVRFLEDGSIVYIGRGDMQLKLHGQRLEGEEVRQRIQDSLYDAQLQVVVDIARFKGQESDILTAYLAEKREYQAGEIAIDAVRQKHLAGIKEHIIGHISAFLPKYMIPSVFLAVTSIPLTANGKLDRRALKAFTAQQRIGSHLVDSEQRSVRPPASEQEKILHSLWQRLLGLESEQFGANSNFFELGGNSLAAIKLSSAARTLGHDLKAQMIFKNPVLSSMATQVLPLNETKTKGPPKFGLLGKVDRSVSQLRKSLEAHGIEEHLVEDAYPLTRQQQCYMEGELLSPGGTTHRHIMQLPVNIDLARLETALSRVVQANPLLRTRFISVSSQLVQVVLKEEFVCRHVEALSTLVSEDRRVSWGLGQQLSRFSIVHSHDAHDQRLVWSSNHVVFDAWSRKLLLEEIDHVYHHNDNAPTRPQYNRFIEYVYELERDEGAAALMKELETAKFWSYFTLDGTKIPGSTRVLSLAVDWPTALPPGLSYSTVVLTAWAVAAAEVEQYEHFLFNILLGGRDAGLTGIDRLMGPVSTTAPLATSINRASTFRENVQSMQDRIDAAGNVQHLVRLGDKVQQLLKSAPTVVVHPADDHEEAPTKYLGMFRSRVEPVQRFVDAMFMNFCLRPGNAGVDLIMAIDPGFFPEDRAVQYLGYLEKIFHRVFSLGGLDLRIDEMELDSCTFTTPVTVRQR